MTPFLPKNAFPLPDPLTPTLVALGLDAETAATVSNVYISTALSLKDRCEAEYVRACSVFVSTSDNRGHSSKDLRSKLLTVVTTRYTQALSQWMQGTIERTKSSLRRKKCVEKPKAKITPVLSGPIRTGNLEPPYKQGSISASGPCPFTTASPLHAFPHAYPPPVRPGPISFVTHIPLLDRKHDQEPKLVPECDLEACIDALARLSLGPPSPSRGSSKPLKTTPRPRLRARATSSSSPTTQLSPSRSRLVSPTLNTSIAVSQSHQRPPAVPSDSSLSDIPRTQNIDIPHSGRRKTCSIPRRRSTSDGSTTSSSPSSPCFSHNISRTPSLVSDHGSEASSPSTPPDFPPMPTHTSTPSRKAPLETAFQSEHPSTHREWWHSIDFGNDVYG